MRSLSDNPVTRSVVPFSATSLSATFSYVTLLALMLLFANVLHAQDSDTSSQVAVTQSVNLKNGWVRQPPPGSRNAAAFFTLHNNTNTAMHLADVQCAAAVAKSCDMHQHIHSEGKMRMQKIDGGLTLPPNSDLRFSPGSYHVMLLDLKEPLENGKTVELVFTFADQSTYHAHLPVKPVNEE